MVGITWPKVVRYLGVYMGYDMNECETQNWEDKLINFQKLLDCWKTKSNTIFSKIHLFVFVALLLPIPKGFVKQLEKLTFNFILGKVDKIRRRSLICSQLEGGIDMIDIVSHFMSLKATWLVRILSNDDPWISYYHII